MGGGGFVANILWRVVAIDTEIIIVLGVLMIRRLLGLLGKMRAMRVQEDEILCGRR